MAVSTCVTLLSSFSIWAGDMIHNLSGITFPANIEHRFTLGPVEDGASNAKKLTFYYLYNDGRRVIVNVYPAPKDAHGPTLLDGDSKSDASPAFMKEFENVKNKYLKKDDSLAIRAQMRFKAAPQQGGVLGMKVTLAGTTTFTDLALFERNGYFVSLSVSYPPDAWLSYGMTYTDVAHFIKWPKPPKT
jgi:hypothetical protein